MNITGIITEYNIFHNGHKYQIDEIKKTFGRSDCRNERQFCTAWRRCDNG